ncbi:MAG TPA: hypothetical protein EYP85_16960 [Armatimonadetes bacterium]|nr:hypothetical protein [Armatimonadota bacterium]
MRKEVSPAVAVVVIVLVILIAVGIYLWSSRRGAGERPPEEAMPAIPGQEGLMPEMEGAPEEAVPLPGVGEEEGAAPAEEEALPSPP